MGMGDNGWGWAAGALVTSQLRAVIKRGSEWEGGVQKE